MEEDAVKLFKQLIEFGGKISSLPSDSDETLSEIGIEIIAGIDVEQSELTAIPIHINLSNSKEIWTFLRSKVVKDAVYSPTTRGIALFDIVDYSKTSMEVQAFLLMVLKCSLLKALNHPIFNKTDIELVISTGDGCYLVFNELANDRFLDLVLIVFTNFKRQLAFMNEKAGCPNTDSNQVYLRIGCELGETDFFLDVRDNKNCYGTGMNEAARILSCGQSKLKNEDTRDSIFLGERLITQANRCKAKYNKVEIKCLGNLSDKHQKTRKVYWMKPLPKNLVFLGDDIQRHLGSLEKT